MSHTLTTKPTFLSFEILEQSECRVPKSLLIFDNETFSSILNYFVWHSGFFETPDLILNSQASQAVQESLCKKGEILSQRLLRLKSFHLKRDTLWKYVTTLFFFASCNVTRRGSSKVRTAMKIIFLNCPSQRCSTFKRFRTILSSF